MNRNKQFGIFYLLLGIIYFCLNHDFLMINENSIGAFLLLTLGFIIYTKDNLNDE